eukprot:7533568-Pyramimonas_sp.AAC.1
MALFSIARGAVAPALAQRTVSTAKPSAARGVRASVKPVRVARAAFGEKSFLSGSSSALHGAASAIKVALPKRRVVKVQAAEDAVPAPVPEEDKKFLGVQVSTLEKVIPLGFMFFCILFNYTILRDTKVSSTGPILPPRVHCWCLLDPSGTNDQVPSPVPIRWLPAV